MEDELQLRVHGEASLPTLIYLPGLHGDWTLIGGFRKAVDGRARFVEITYPRTLTWSLDDYAAAIETALARNGITGGWLLGESYGSQILWALVGRNRFQAQGAILAGGFVKYPMRRVLQMGERIGGDPLLSFLTRIVFIGANKTFLRFYVKIARYRYRRSPETLAKIDEFVVRRTDLDRRAAQHRLHLISQHDPRPVARRTALPVFGLSGFLDPIVPWPFTRRWLRKNCPALRDYKIIRRADHNVLCTAPREAAQQVLDWMTLPK